MSDSAELKLCILWEDELRVAAGHLMRLEEIPDDAEHKKERTECIFEGYRACQVALWGLTKEKVAVLVGSGHIRDASRKAAKRERSK